MKKLLICFVLLPIFFINCEGEFFSSLSDYTFTAYAGSLTTELLNSDASFSAREDFATVVFDNSIWVMGGYDCSARGRDDGYREDVYRSSDGINWTLVSDDAPWKGRRALEATVFNDYIYISGGFCVDDTTNDRSFKNDLWRTQDGINWEEVTSDAPWDARMNHAMVGTDNYIYLFGGFVQDNGPQYLSDMWKYDGANWTELTENIDFGGRAAFAYCKNDNFLYLQGGSYSGMTQSSSGTTDTSVSGWNALWKFDLNDESKGWKTTWKDPLNSSHSRSEHSLISFNDNVWMFSGKSNSSLAFSNSEKNYLTSYYSPSINESLNNGEWTLDSLGGIVEPRYSYECEVFNDNIILIGGYSSDGPKNDVWQITESEDN